MNASTTEPPAPTSVILAAVAFDPTGECALLEAARLAEQTPNSELHVVHVVAKTEVNRELMAIDIRLTGAPEELRRRVEQMWLAHRCDVIAHVRSGRPAKQILQTALDLDADLIVVGTHRRTGLEKLVLGSVAQSVLQDAPCPVLLAVPKDARSARVEGIEPPCPACVTVRDASGDGEYRYWCDRHARSHVQQHLYQSYSSQRPAAMPTY
jgi:nucleotide-binding universal stress UspA family protein